MNLIVLTGQVSVFVCEDRGEKDYILITMWHRENPEPVVGFSMV